MALPGRVAVPPEQPISMGEGGTPLLRQLLHGAPALLKCEWMMPTGSFKDRGASVMLSLLRAQGIKGSAGGQFRQRRRGGGGICRRRRYAGDLMAPASTSPAKTVQMRAHGARWNWCPVRRQDTADAAVHARRRSFMPATIGTRFSCKAPRHWLMNCGRSLASAHRKCHHACGAGSNVLGCEIGFAELLRAGEIDAMPRLFAVQPPNCAPIAAAFLRNDESPLRSVPTIAEGTAIARRYACARCWVHCADARRRGDADRAEIVVPRWNCPNGVYVEPTAAQPAAAFGKLLDTGVVTPDQTTVLVLTGSGLKATPGLPN